MERFLQAHLLGDARRISLSKSPYHLPSQPASSAEAPSVLCQLLIGPSSERAAPHGVCGGVPHSGYDTKHITTFDNSFIIKHHVSPDVSITFCSFFTVDGEGPMHFGTCSTWLNTIKRGHTVPCFIHRYC